jgi:thiamine phosphate synthase YjbQ (UPF0047 family)
MSITPVYLESQKLDYHYYAGLPINEFKNNLHQQIKALLDKALPQVNKYKKVTFWCSDER